jgi:hypothetical protein
MDKLQEVAQQTSLTTLLSLHLVCMEFSEKSFTSLVRFALLSLARHALSQPWMDEADIPRIWITFCRC